MIILGSLKQRRITTTEAMAFLKKGSRAVSKFIALFFLVVQLPDAVEFFWNFICVYVLKRQIRKFHVVVGVQRRQGNVLVNETYCFLPFSSLSLSSLLKLPIWW